MRVCLCMSVYVSEGQKTTKASKILFNYLDVVQKYVLFFWRGCLEQSLTRHEKPQT